MRSSGAGRNIALKLAKAGKEWKAAAAVRMPEARGDIREIIGEPVFVPLQKLAITYGKTGFLTARICSSHIASPLAFLSPASMWEDQLHCCLMKLGSAREHDPSTCEQQTFAPFASCLLAM